VIKLCQIGLGKAEVIWCHLLQNHAILDVCVLVGDRHVLNYDELCLLKLAMNGFNLIN
jgi:hypothetical protein